MKAPVLWILLACAVLNVSGAAVDPADASPKQAPLALDDPLPTAPSGVARYSNTRQNGLPGTAVKSYRIGWGSVERTTNGVYQWLLVDATKANGTIFRLWLLTRGYPAETREAALQKMARFILQQGTSQPQEFRDRTTGAPVLPSLGGWIHLFPRGTGQGPDGSIGFPQESRYLGHTYRLAGLDQSASIPGPPDPKVFQLLPDVLVGLPSNTRQKGPARRYDGSEYEYVRLTRADYAEMAEAGINCVRVDKDQLPFVEDRDVFYWGLGAAEIGFPESLYDSRYLGPALFLDEPAVSTRDSVIRSRLAKDDAFRRAITPGMAFDAFCEFYRRAWQDGAATSLFAGLAGRAEIDAGEMRFRQENLYSWETMVSTAAYQLSQDAQVPNAIVFEPPGRVGTRRTLPEIDMTYGCQIPTDNPNFFIDLIYGFLRGAARLTGKQWGTSIYGAVDRTDAFGFLTRAYDLGGTRFFFWDNAQLACVPYPECLGLARALKARAENYPVRDVENLRKAAEVAIVLPAGYNLGHVYLGKGNLWGLSELNLERLNADGVNYRTVMSNFFIEVERCLRLGVAFDALGEFPGMEAKGYRQVVRIREDGKVEIREGDRSELLDHARLPERPPGPAPGLNVDVSQREGRSPLSISARAVATEKAAPIFYTHGTDAKGIYRNAAVAWELYGPTDADHRFLTPAQINPHIRSTRREYESVVELKLQRPGSYKLRAATVDVAGRTAVVWTPITVNGD